MCNLYEYDMTEEDMRLLMEHYKRIGTNWPGPTKVYPNMEAPVIRSVDDGERYLDNALGRPTLEGARPHQPPKPRLGDVEALAR